MITRTTKNKECDTGTFTGEGWKTYKRETTGWQPTCECDAGDPIPCSVLDMFAGACTVGLEADRLGRDAELIELNPDCAEMGRKRIKDASPMFAEVVMSTWEGEVRR